MIFSDQSLEELKEIIARKKLDFYDKFEDVELLIKQVFELNPHSVHTLNKHKEGIYGIALDNLNIVYTMDETHNIINIVKKSLTLSKLSTLSSVYSQHSQNDNIINSAHAHIVHFVNIIRICIIKSVIVHINTINSMQLNKKK